jgi:8-oxo-dGTP pyrophosphatase MutT (NUDIX family)
MSTSKNSATLPVEGQSAPPAKAPLAVSCGTLVVNPAGELLLCHVTNTASWDIPKGLQDPGETTLAAAMRELREEAGIAFPAQRFEELGCFDYRRDKLLHLYKVKADAGDQLDTLDRLVCTSFFPHHVTGQPTPEADGFRWAARDEIRTLCWPRMAERLLALDW